MHLRAGEFDRAASSLCMVERGRNTIGHELGWGGAASSVGAEHWQTGVLYKCTLLVHSITAQYIVEF